VERNSPAGPLLDLGEKVVSCLYQGYIYFEQNMGARYNVYFGRHFVLLKYFNSLSTGTGFTRGGGALRSEIHERIMLIWNKEELPHQWKESIVVPIHKKGDKTDCSNYRGISLLSTSYKILSNILLSRLISYADEIIGDHQCGF